MHVLSFSTHFQIIFMFSILSDEVSHILHLASPSGSHQMLTVDSAYPEVELLWTLDLECFSLIDIVIVNMNCKIK